MTALFGLALIFIYLAGALAVAWVWLRLCDWIRGTDRPADVSLARSREVPARWWS